MFSNYTSCKFFMSQIFLLFSLRHTDKKPRFPYNITQDAFLLFYRKKKSAYGGRLIFLTREKNDTFFLQLTAVTRVHKY